MRVKATIESGECENDEGYEVDCVSATCSKCGHEEWAYGDGDSSRRACLALLAKRCPRSERNFYVEA
jgi:hypothetical protein